MDLLPSREGITRTRSPSCVHFLDRERAADHVTGEVVPAFGIQFLAVLPNTLVYRTCRRVA